MLGAGLPVALDAADLAPHALAGTLLGLAGDPDVAAEPAVYELIDYVAPYVDLALQPVVRFGRPRVPGDGVTCVDALVGHERDVHGRVLASPQQGTDMQKVVGAGKSPGVVGFRDGDRPG